jgi:hypothetical protein
VSKTFFICLLTVAFLACSAYAQLRDLEIEGSNSLHFDEGYEVNKDAVQAGAIYPDNTIARHFIENRLRLDIYKGNLRIGGRLLYFRPSTADIAQYKIEDESKIDKRYLEATLDPLKLRFGDFSDLWGHGLALSCFENRDLYFDSELDGVRIQADAGPFTIIGLRGSSKQGLLVNAADVTGARVTANFNGSGAGFNYVFIDSSVYPEHHIASVDWNLQYGMLSLYGERAWNKVLASKKPTEGHATYVGVTLSKWKWSLLADYKDYDYKIVTPFQNPPTVYREIGPRVLQGREPHVLNVPDEVGYQVELSGQALEKTFVTLHYNLSSHHPKDQTGIPRPSLKQNDFAYWESFVNVDQDLPASRKVFVEVGENEEATAVWQQRTWGQVRFTTPFLTKHDLEFEIKQMQITDKLRDDKKLWDQMYSVGWNNGDFLSLTLVYQMSNDKDLKNREGKDWPSAEAAVTFGQGKHRVIAFYGRERGGLKCSNGVCRPVQAFSGFRLTFESTF